MLNLVVCIYSFRVVLTTKRYIDDMWISLKASISAGLHIKSGQF